MADNTHGDKVFDFSSPVNKDTAEGGKKTEKRITYTLFQGEDNTLSMDKPMIVLSKEQGDILHHQNGFFSDIKNNSTFEIQKDGKKVFIDILKLDSRFQKFIAWLGENRIYVKLSCKPVEDGYSVYRIHAVNKTGRVKDDTDGFLQFTISRILDSQITEDEDEDDDDKRDLGDIVSEDYYLSDINSMSGFLSCAGSTLPKNIRKWAVNNINLTKSGNISEDERRHAKRALSIMLNIEWKGTYFEAIDPVEARRILDEELYGMDKIKQRIIETIIQINRTHTLPAYGLLLAGPAGVGKSQLAYAVAKILKMPWGSLDMSTIHDSEAITGSSRVYANAKPGLIMEAFQRAGSSNIAFIINELDKADSNSTNGNPADALLTLLDNLGYTDNYIECVIPTMGVYPIATANDKSKISDPLMSRFAVIDIPDYTPEEKKIIFKEYSLPKILKRMGMDKEECVIDDSGVDAVVEKCKNNSGCRDLEQAAEHLAANALFKIETQNLDKVVFDRDAVQEIIEG